MPATAKSSISSATLERPSANGHAGFHADIARRRAVRDFDRREVPREVIEHCLLAAGAAPLGANQQPWFSSVIADAARKHRIREAAAAEEREPAALSSPRCTTPGWPP